MAPQTQPPRRDAVLILGVLPMVYIAKQHFGIPSLLPGFIPFWTSVVVLHAVSVSLVFWSLRRNGNVPRDIGLPVGLRQLLRLIAGLAAVGGFVFLFREYTAIGAA